MRRPARVLVVDDQPANLALVRRILEPAGYEIYEARSGAETLALAQEKVPDLILLDMHLPDLHGLDVMRRLREEPRSADIRIVAMSALATPEDRGLWLQAGCAGYIEKPINVRGFPTEVARWLPGASAAETNERPPDGNRHSDKLGELLVANLLISPEQLSRAVATQPESGKRLGQILVEQGALSEDDMAWALSHQLGYPYVFLTSEIIDPDAVRLLPELFLRQRRILPILKFGQEMTMAMVDPTDQQTIEEVTARTGLQVKRALALSSNIEEMHKLFFPGLGAAVREAPMAWATEAQYLQFHLVQTLQQGGTKIHLDPGAGGQARVRYRLQGELVDRPGQPLDLHAAMLRYLRELTGIGNAPSGTAARTLTIGDREAILIATFLPTIAGDSAAVTIYPVQTDPPDLPALGVAEETVAPIRDLLRSASGAVLVGCNDRWVRATLMHGLIPAGSRGMIWSLESAPVYRRSTINQTLLPLHADRAGAIRLAADAGADLIAVDDASAREALVGAFEAARVRLVLAGYAEGDIAAALTQALESAGPALTASTLRAVVAARPIRLLCPACKQPINGEGGAFHGQRTFGPSGCEACGFTGFKGRRLLTDVWLADAESRRLLRAGHAGLVLDRIAQAGFRMREAGRALVLDGLASADELTRATE
jgi:type IV pilus assembly protein PilB